MGGRARTAAIIAAAGRGDRFGGPKHDLIIDGTPAWQRCVDRFDEVGIPSVVVGDVPGGVEGGMRRRDSVSAGLAAIGDVEWVLVHDAARPLVSTALIRTVVERLEAGDVDAVIPATHITDTVKRLEADRVVSTVDRTSLVTVQTPQGFRASTLIEAHRVDPGDDVTDDAGLVERIGGIVVVVQGDPSNIKITHEGDLERARRLVEKEGHRG